MRKPAMKFAKYPLLLIGLLLLGAVSTQIIRAASGSDAVRHAIGAAPELAPNQQGCSGQPQIQYAFANPPTINSGQVTTLSWGLVGNANAAFLQAPNGHRTGIGTPGSQQVNPTQTSTWFIVGVCGSTETQVPITVTVNNAPGCSGSPQMNGFSANPSTIQNGQTSTLSWGPVNNAQSVQLSAQNQGSSGVPAPGSAPVHPNTTTTYFLTAWCQNNSVQSQVTVNVNNPPAPTPTPQPIYPGNNEVQSIQVQTSDQQNWTLHVGYYWNGSQPPGRMNAAGTNSNPNQATNTGASNLTPGQNLTTTINVVSVGRGVPTQFWACMVGTGNVELACKTVNYP